MESCFGDFQWVLYLWIEVQIKIVGSGSQITGWRSVKISEGPVRNLGKKGQKDGKSWKKENKFSFCSLPSFSFLSVPGPYVPKALSSLVVWYTFGLSFHFGKMIKEWAESELSLSKKIIRSVLTRAFEHFITRRLQRIVNFFCFFLWNWNFYDSKLWANGVFY